MKAIIKVLKDSLGFWSNPKKNWKWMLIEIVCIAIVYLILTKIL